MPRVPLPGNWQAAIRKITGLRYSKKGGLWYYPETHDGVRAMPDWVPGWFNGGDTKEIWDWLVLQERIGGLHGQETQAKKAVS